ncbi:hypothetical protein T11_4880 [Trichinella zimbabwensis]|uniref:Uncharacterized protein n=1 Tax=Trichinella zimbabwensis TaxID=268475 RepID=A0A0V1I170_9BILA|nr:hypothetical protein T11_4880 [Trichinella zimbabwensis]
MLAEQLPNYVIASVILSGAFSFNCLQLLRGGSPCKFILAQESLFCEVLYNFIAASIPKEYKIKQTE